MTIERDRAHIHGQFLVARVQFYDLPQIVRIGVERARPAIIGDAERVTDPQADLRIVQRFFPQPRTLRHRRSRWMRSDGARVTASTVGVAGGQRVLGAENPRGA